MAKNNLVAVLLPARSIACETKSRPSTCFASVGCPWRSPVIAIRALRPCFAAPVLNMACTLFRLTPEEALAGITREGARALGKEGEIGTLASAKSDLAVWRIGHPAELCYWSVIPDRRDGSWRAGA